MGARTRRREKREGRGLEPQEGTSPCLGLPGPAPLLGAHAAVGPLPQPGKEAPVPPPVHAGHPHYQHLGEFSRGDGPSLVGVAAVEDHGHLGIGRALA